MDPLDQFIEQQIGGGGAGGAGGATFPTSQPDALDAFLDAQIGAGAVQGASPVQTAYEFDSSGRPIVAPVRRVPALTSRTDRQRIDLAAKMASDPYGSYMAAPPPAGPVENFGRGLLPALAQFVPPMSPALADLQTAMESRPAPDDGSVAGFAGSAIGSIAPFLVPGTQPVALASAAANTAQDVLDTASKPKQLREAAVERFASEAKRLPGPEDAERIRQIEAQIQSNAAPVAIASGAAEVVTEFTGLKVLEKLGGSIAKRIIKAARGGDGAAKEIAKAVGETAGAAAASSVEELSALGLQEAAKYAGGFQTGEQTIENVKSQAGPTAAVGAIAGGGVAAPVLVGKSLAASSAAKAESRSRDIEAASEGLRRWNAAFEAARTGDRVQSASGQGAGEVATPAAEVPAEPATPGDQVPGTPAETPVSPSTATTPPVPSERLGSPLPGGQSPDSAPARAVDAVSGSSPETMGRVEPEATPSVPPAPIVAPARPADETLAPDAVVPNPARDAPLPEAAPAAEGAVEPWSKKRVGERKKLIDQAAPGAELDATNAPVELATLIKGVREGKQRFQTGKDSTGRKLSDGELEAVRQSVESGMERVRSARKAPPADVDAEAGGTERLQGVGYTARDAASRSNANRDNPVQLDGLASSNTTPTPAASSAPQGTGVSRTPVRPPERMTIAALRAELEQGGVEVAAGTPRKELISGVKELRALPNAVPNPAPAPSDPPQAPQAQVDQSRQDGSENVVSVGAAGQAGNPIARGTPETWAAGMAKTKYGKAYAQYKKNDPNIVYLFKVGDFYEAFSEDAVTLSRTLGLTLTQKGDGPPMAGFSGANLETQLRKIINAGKRVAIVEEKGGTSLEPTPAEPPSSVQSGGAVESARPGEGAQTPVRPAPAQSGNPAESAVEASIDDIDAELATRAFSGTSFVPERRGVQWRQDYVNTFNAVRDRLAPLAKTPEQRSQLQTELARFKDGLAQRFRDFLSSHGRVVSTMIAGPSNFPAARMNKYSDWASTKLKEVVEYQQRAERAMRRTLSPDDGTIRSDQKNAVEALQTKIDEAKKLQEAMRAGNRIVRNSKLSREQKLKELTALGLKEKTAETALTNVPGYGMGFPGFALQNNLANIKRMESRVRELSRLQAAEARTASFDGGRIEEDKGDTRVRIFFDAKPDDAMRSKLKSRGFRWAPSEGAWQRLANEAGWRAAMDVTGAKQVTSNPEPEPAVELSASQQQLVAETASEVGSTQDNAAPTNPPATPESSPATPKVAAATPNVAMADPAPASGSPDQHFWPTPETITLDDGTSVKRYTLPNGYEITEDAGANYYLRQKSGPASIDRGVYPNLVLAVEAALPNQASQMVGTIDIHPDYKNGGWKATDTFDGARTTVAGRWNTRAEAVKHFRDIQAKKDQERAGYAAAATGPIGLGQLQAFQNDLRNGIVTADYLKAYFARAVASEKGIKTELGYKTVADLRRMAGPFARGSKKQLIDSVYDRILMQFNIGDSLVFNPMTDPMGRNALTEAVNKTTDEMIRADFEKTQREIDERRKSLENPQTLTDFDRFVRVKGEKALTSEQRAKWDELKANFTKGQRQAEAERSKAIDKVDTEGVSFEVVEVGGVSEKLPEGSFESDDAFRKTGVNTRLVTIDKPGEAAAPVHTQTTTKWFETLDADRREAVFAAMRTMDDVMERADKRFRELSPPSGQTAVGSAHMDAFFEANAAGEFLRALNRGLDPDSAASAAKAAQTEAVKVHNSRRGDKDWQRAATVRHDQIDTMARTIKDAAANKPVQFEQNRARQALTDAGYLSDVEARTFKERINNLDGNVPADTDAIIADIKKSDEAQGERQRAEEAARDKANAERAAEYSRSARPYDPENQSLRKGDPWDGNVAENPESSKYLTDGRAMLLRTAVLKKGELSKISKPGTGFSRFVPPQATQEVWDQAVAEATQPVEIIGTFDPLADHRTGYNATAVRLDDDSVRFLNEKYLALMARLVGWDQIRLPEPGKGRKNSPAVLYRGGVPVAVVMPINREGMPDIDVAVAKKAVSEWKPPPAGDLPSPEALGIVPPGVRHLWHATDILTDHAKYTWQTLARIGGRATTYLNTLGTEGRAMAKEVNRIAQQAQKRGNIDEADADAVIRSVPRAQRHLLGKIANGYADPKTGTLYRTLHPAIAKAADKLQAIADRSRLEADAIRARDQGKGVGFSGKWYPQVPNAAGRDFLARAKIMAAGGVPDPELVQWADAQVKSGNAASPEQALSELVSFYESRMRGINRYMERSRVLIPEKYVNWDAAEIIPSLLRKNAMFVEATKVWGWDLDGAYARIARIASQSGQQHQMPILTNWIKANFDAFQEDTKAKKLLGAWSNFETFTRLGLSPLSVAQNATQMVVNTVRMPPSAVAQALAQYPPIVGRWIKASQGYADRARRAGATSDAGAIEQPEARAPFAKAAQAVMQPFGAVESDNQIVAANAAYIALTNDMAKLLADRSLPETKPLRRAIDAALSLSGIYEGADARVRRVQDLTGMTREQLKKRIVSGERLTAEEMEQAMYRMTSDTQFTMDIASEPVWWRNNPALRLLAKFKNWPIRQTGFIAKHVLKEAALGNFAPLTRFVIATIIAGELIAALKDLLRGQETSAVMYAMRNEGADLRGTAERMVGSMKQAGAFGFLVDMTYGVGAFIFGPAGGTVENVTRRGTEALAAGTAGNTKAALAALDKAARDQATVYRFGQDVARLVSSDMGRVQYINTWRSRAHSYAETRDADTPGKKVVQIVGRTLYGNDREFMPTERTLGLQYAARAIDAGNLDKAVPYLAEMIRNTPPAKRPQVLRAIRQSASIRSPLGRVPESERAKFLNTFTPAERQKAIRTNSEWKQMYLKALSQAMRDARTSQ